MGRAVGALLLVFGASAFAGYRYRAELERFGGEVVDVLGPIGMGVGTFLAEFVHFPIPPQFYMFAAIAGHESDARALFAIGVGSIAGGSAAFLASRALSGSRLLLRRTRRVRRTIAGYVERFGPGAIVVGSLLPVPYSHLCYLAGLMRLPPRLFVLLCILRIPKLFLFYALIRAGWA